MVYTRLGFGLALGVALSFAACASGEDSGVGEGGSSATDGGTTGGSSGSGATGGSGGSSTGGSGGSTTGGSAGAGGSTDGGGCIDDSECSGTTPVCDTSTGTCVECLPAQDNCASGLYCDSSNTCVSGCGDDSDCPAGQNCDVTTHLCVDCIDDTGCGIGTVCSANKCVPGCSATQPCPSSQTCCGTACVDTLTSLSNCGGCGQACADLANASETCYNGVCGLGACAVGYTNCNQNPADGCEVAGNTCSCTLNSTQSCYFGPAGTAGKGICKSGTQTCTSTGWGPCNGMVLPAAEVCGNSLDDDCDGQTDEDSDADGDGWGTCSGDCCDVVGPNCANPGLVNPGAFEVAGNNVDDDCDGTSDNPLPLCDSGLASSSSTGLDYAKAIDLCQVTTENPPLSQKKWGVINAQLLLANAAGTPSANSRSIRPGFGNVIVPKKGQRLAVLSTGHAADQNDTNPGFQQFQDGANMNTSSPFPADWYQANGNKLPSAGGCPQPQSAAANDPVMLKIRVRVPTNAQSFSAKLYFFSAEYPEYVCTVFNDFFVTLVDSQVTSNPSDKNIAIYSNGTQSWPVGVNLLKAASGLFKQCTNGQISQCDQPGGPGGPKNKTYNGCIGTNELAGTGFDITGVTPFSCNYAGMHGGGTSWLNMKGNVSPGEVMEIRFVIWDTQDHLFDSLVLLDDWQWSVQASQPGVTPDG